MINKDSEGSASAAHWRHNQKLQITVIFIPYLYPYIYFTLFLINTNISICCFNCILTQIFGILRRTERSVILINLL